jgi:hypothetical protein
MRAGIVALVVLAVAGSAQAQTEDALRQFFEGKRVVVRQDMPATQLGVDVQVEWSGEGRMAFDAYARNLKAHGVSLVHGATAMVTKVKVKGDTIEVQLDGGGYGTFFDQTDPKASWTPVPKSDRERDLERLLDNEPDRRERDRIRRELDDLRDRRERENGRRRRDAEEQTRINAERIESRRQQGGSRFNLRFPGDVGQDQMRPELVMRALSEYLSYPWVEAARPARRPQPPRQAAGGVGLRKGMALAEVENLLGRPIRQAKRNEGSLVLDVRTYETARDVIEVQFLDGVLVKYSVSSK